MARATPMPPEERRAAIISATAPLLRERGRDVSTREIAEAAGIAEGTIFRVFDSKEDVIDAVVHDAFDPSSSFAALDAIDRGLDLDVRVGLAVAIIQERLHRVFGLVHVLGFRPTPGDGPPKRPHAIDRAMENATLAAVLAPDADRLQVSPERGATLLSALVLALTHPMMRGACGDASLSDPAEVADIFLHGIVAQDTLPPPPAERNIPVSNRQPISEGA